MRSCGIAGAEAHVGVAVAQKGLSIAREINDKWLSLAGLQGASKRLGMGVWGLGLRVAG